MTQFNQLANKNKIIYLISSKCKLLSFFKINSFKMRNSTVSLSVRSNMFGFLKKKKPANDLDNVTYHLQMMGYDLLPYGVSVAQVELSSGYNAIETASHIAFTTMALDVKEIGDDVMALAAFMPHAKALLELLKEYKDKKLMNPTQWDNDARAIYHIVTVDEHQLEWIDKILSDPIAGKARLAKSRIDYEF